MQKSILITYLMTYGGATASLFNPYYGLLVYVSFSIIRPESLWHWAVPPGNYSRVVGIALLLGWVLRGFGDWKLGRARSVVFALIGFMGWTVLGSFLAPNKDVAWAFTESLAKIVLPFLVGITTIDTVRQLRGLAWVIVLSQAYVAFDLYGTYRAGYNRLQDQGFGGMDNNCYAIGLVAAAGLAFFLGFGERRLLARLVAWVSALLITNTMFLAFSRGAMLGMIVTGLASFWLIPKQPKHYLVLFLALLVGLRLAGAQVQERFFTILSNDEKADSDGGGRPKLWKTMARVMTEHPVTGVGPDHWPLIAHEYGFTRGKAGHSLWLEMGADLGFPGLGLLLGFYGLCIVELRRLLRRQAKIIDPWIPDAARMVTASLIGFMVAAQFVTLIGLEMPYFICLIGAGVLKLNSDVEGSAGFVPGGSL